jgi:ABC-2 type transport system permease protein
MSRILTIAQSEFLTLVKTKAFIFGLLLMPVLMAGFFFFMSYAQQHIDVERRPFAVIDHTGLLFAPLRAAADQRNAPLVSGDTRTGPEFVPSEIALGGRSMDDVKVELSEQVRRDELFAFVEIPAEVLTATRGEVPAIHYYTENTSYEPLPDWLRTTLNEEITKRRFDQAGIDQALITRLNTRTPLSTFGLMERGADGAVIEAKEVDALARMALPFFLLVLMFMAVMTTAQQLLNAIIEEKMSKISEVLLGSVTPFQLLMGKLLGVVGVALLLALVYFSGGLYALMSSGRLDLVNPAILAWFLVFLICASLLYGSIFLALGSACSDLKDAQSMMQPAMVLILLAYMGSFIVIQNPESNVAVGMSFFPTMTPFAMMLRMAMPPGPPLWQVLLSVALLITTTAFCVWAGGRIFRIGILMQGKAPTLPELLKWIRA